MPLLIQAQFFFFFQMKQKRIHSKHQKQQNPTHDVYIQLIRNTAVLL